MNEIQDIEQLDNDIQMWDAAFAVAMLALNGSLLRELYSLIDRLVLKGRATTYAEVMANFQTVVTWQADLPNTLFRVGFDDILNGLLAHMGQSAERMNRYYGKILSDFNPGAYNNLVAQLTEQTRTLVTSTLESTYQRVVGDVLTNGVMTKSTAAELRATLAERLQNEGLSTRPVNTVASDSLYTFTRAYSQAVAEGLNLKHYYYMGTQIATTRSFCAARFGRVFTQKEVEEWPELTWTGKIPGTNKQTIFWYCGGFNCRHRLLPISKTLYTNFLNNNN